MKPYVVGITGGMGSGKSAVSRLLSSYCLAPLLDLDRICRTLLQKNQPGWHALKHRFGSRFFDHDGALDRALLRASIFADADLRRHIDSLLHPLARIVMREEVAQSAVPIICIEIPLLYEVGWQDDVDAVVVVYARPGARCGRIVCRDGVTRSQAARAMKAQMPLAEKARLADYVIDNSGRWTKTRTQVVALGEKLSSTVQG